MVYSNRTGSPAAQRNTLVPDLALSEIPSALSWIVHMLLWGSLTLWHMSTVHSPFLRLITSNFSSIQIVFHWVFTWIALGAVDLCFSFILVRKANHQHNQFIYMTDGVTVTSLSASLLQKISTAMDHLWKIMLKQNCTKRNCVKWDLPVHAYTLLYLGYSSAKRAIHK